MRIKLRFSLRVLLVVVAISAVPIAWFCHRMRVMNAERERLVGTWELDGTNLRYEFSSHGFEVGMPHDGIGQIDFYDAGNGKTVKGIYRFSGDLLEVAANVFDLDKPRPANFDKGEAHNIWRRINPENPKH